MQKCRDLVNACPIPKMSQLLPELFLKEIKCYGCAFLFPCFFLPLSQEANPVQLVCVLPPLALLQA